jgi:hypothetical protein
LPAHRTLCMRGSNARAALKATAEGYRAIAAQLSPSIDQRAAAAEKCCGA